MLGVSICVFSTLISQHALTLLKVNLEHCSNAATLKDLGKGRSRSQLLFLPRLNFLTCILAGIRFRSKQVAVYAKHAKAICDELLSADSSTLDPWDEALIMLLPRLYNEFAHVDTRPLPAYVEAFGSMPEESRAAMEWIKKTISSPVLQKVMQHGMLRPDYNSWLQQTMLGLNRDPANVVWQRT